MSHKHYINESRGSFRHVLTTEEYLDSSANGYVSPFKPRSIPARIIARLQRFVAKFAETVLDTTLFTDNHLKELAAIRPDIRALLLRYLRNGFIKSWTIDVVTQTISYVVGVTIEVNNLKTKDGRTVKLIGANGCGVGYTVNDALIPALAELIERHSASLIDTQRLQYGSAKELHSSGALDLERFRYFSEQQRNSTPELLRNEFDNDTKIHWIGGQDALNVRHVLMPAQLVYHFYSFEYKDEPIFFETNSSGVAAYSDETNAKISATLELIERHTFLDHWLHKKRPQEIDIASINDEELQYLIRHIQSQSFNLAVYNFPNEMRIPVIIAVITGSDNRYFVSVGAGCGFDIQKATRKALFETARIAQFYDQPSEDDIFKAALTYPNFTTFKDRTAWWADSKNDAYLTFLRGGTVRDYTELVSATDIETPKGGPHLIYQHLRDTLREHNVELFLVDITSQEARTVGLSVYRAIAPQLIPSYFKEYARPLNHPRLRQAATDSIINPVPHPFI